MSVIHLTATEIAAFAAAAYKLELLPYDRLAPLAMAISEGNVAAWADTYEDRVEPINLEEFEAVLLRFLAHEEDLIDAHFSPLAYNMMANSGREYVSVYGAPVAEGDPGADLIAGLKALEDKVRKWHEAKARELRRAEENAVAFNEVGKLPMKTGKEIAEIAAAKGMKRVIVAEFKVNESDMMSDYHNGRTARTVVIGFGKGKREDFRNLRKAAARFLPTAHLGPGKDMFSVWVNREEPTAGSYVRSTKEGDTYATEAEAEAFIAKLIADDMADGAGVGIAAKYYGYTIGRNSVENRENYSMGDGNYLGWSRYGGWKVWSYPADAGYYENHRLEYYA